MKFFATATAAAVAATTTLAAAAEVNVVVSTDGRADFSLSVGDVNWLNSGSVRFFVDDSWHSVESGTLKLVNTVAGHGADVHGEYNETSFTWNAGTTPIDTKIKVL